MQWFYLVSDVRCDTLFSDLSKAQTVYPTLEVFEDHWEHEGKEFHYGQFSESEAGKVTVYRFETPLDCEMAERVVKNNHRCGKDGA